MKTMTTWLMLMMMITRCQRTQVQPRRRLFSLSLLPTWIWRWVRRGGLFRLRPALLFKWCFFFFIVIITVIMVIVVIIAMMIITRWCSQVLEPWLSSFSRATYQTHGAPYLKLKYWRWCWQWWEWRLWWWQWEWEWQYKALWQWQW